jgi:ABC-type transport system involved in cytochrome c biogenesis permease subunit
MALEVTYNHWAPFRFAWVLVLAALVAMLLHLGSGWKWLYVAAMTAYGAGLAALVIGFSMRIAIAGRPPVSNMYESVIYVGAGVALFGLIFELIYRQKYILTAAAAVSTVALVLADNCPTILDPSVQPLEPVLRSNFWLVTHVMTITLSYAAFALALGIANITLGYFCARSSDRSAISSLSRFTYKAIQVGVLLLAAGTILGGVWADYSWGRFWGWDPKEVWALVALLGYLAVLHARYAGWVGHRGLAALAVTCFSLVVMAWYGVNFVLGAGLHSYGFGGGGAAYVYSAVILQLLFAATALIRSRGEWAAEQPPNPTTTTADFATPATALSGK